MQNKPINTQIKKTKFKPPNKFENNAYMLHNIALSAKV